MVATSAPYLYAIGGVHKAKFHYAIRFEAGRDQLRTSFEPASVMEFGFYGLCNVLYVTEMQYNFML